MPRQCPGMWLASGPGTPLHGATEHRLGMLGQWRVPQKPVANHPLWPWASSSLRASVSSERGVGGSGKDTSSPGSGLLSVRFRVKGPRTGLGGPHRHREGVGVPDGTVGFLKAQGPAGQGPRQEPPAAPLGSLACPCAIRVLSVPICQRGKQPCPLPACLPAPPQHSPGVRLAPGWEGAL